MRVEQTKCEWKRKNKIGEWGRDVMEGYFGGGGNVGVEERNNRKMWKRQHVGGGENRIGR